MNSPDPTRFVRHIAFPTLKEISSYRVALSIWSSYIKIKKISGNTLMDAFDIGDEYCEECDQMIKSLKTPISVEKLLKSTLSSISSKTISFITYFHEKVFFHEFDRIKHYDVDWFVWLTNGVIDYAKTASKILSSPGLNLKQRFIIMSVFCMEEEIEKFPLHLLPDSTITEWTFETNYLLYYWICYLKKELYKIQLPGLNSVDAVMIYKCRENYREAFEYFWHRLGEDEQVFVTKHMLNRNYSCIHLLRVFLTMSSQQQHLLLSKMPYRLLVNFWTSAQSPEAAMWIWSNSKHLISPQQFGRIVYKVFCRRTVRYNTVRLFIGGKPRWCLVPYDGDLRLFLQMWHSASDDQKDFVIQTMGEKIFIPFVQPVDIATKAAFEFLYIFLSLKDAEFRRQAILKNALTLGWTIEDPTSMNKIIQLCLPNPDEELEYKKLIMDSENMEYEAQMLFNKGNLEVMFRLLKCFPTDANVARQFLESKNTKKKKYVTEVKKWNTLSQFVDQVFSQDVTSALNFKKEFITLYARDCLHGWNDDSLDQTIKILNMVFTNDDELQVLKKCFFDSFQKQFFSSAYWQRFEQNYCHKFLSWCLNGDENAVIEFIKNLPVDAIVDEVFKKLEYWYEDDDYESSERKLRGLDMLLKWYLKTIEGGVAREYKLARVEAFQETKLFYLILEREDETILGIVLNWLFDDDHESVLKFKKENVEVVLEEVRKGLGVLI